MVKLSRAEEQLMEIIWQGREMFMKDILESYPEPKLAVTTVATLLKRMQDKGVIGYQPVGNLRRYYPLIRKDDYFAKHIGNMVKDFFGDSALQFASFFTTSGNLSTEELEDLKEIIEQEIKRQKS
jgi:predicted transcriptional regulator